jgi:hypothetical protein
LWKEPLGFSAQSGGQTWIQRCRKSQERLFEKERAIRRGSKLEKIT